MNRKSFQDLTDLRVKEAEVLFERGRYEGAYYLMGYAVECALKACIAKQTKEHDFPDKRFAVNVHTHELEKLAKGSGLWTEFEKELKLNKALEVNWATVKDWSEDARYDVGVGEAFAKDFFEACTDPTSGVLNWIKQRW